MPKKTVDAKRSASKPEPFPEPIGPTLLTLDLATVESLVALLEKSKLTELEIETGDARIFLSKNGPDAVAGGMPTYLPAPQAAPAAAPVEMKAEAPVSNRKLVEVTSPMVGTFYASPSPDADAYVRDGMFIKEGQTLCIIEAMKLMNEIEAEVTGRVVEICAKNAQPVEFGSVLFRIEPSV